MVAAVQLEPTRIQILTPQSDRERHVAIVLCLWRCRVDYGKWPEIDYVAEETRIPASVVALDIETLIRQKIVAPRGAAYKVIVRREIE